MKPLLFLIGLLLWSAPLGMANTHTYRTQPIPVKLIVGGHESLKAGINSFFKRELRSLGDVQIVEEQQVLQIKVDGMALDSKKNTIQYVISIILLDGQGQFLANDLGIGATHSEMHEIAQKIIAQVDSLYLDPLRKNQFTPRSTPPTVAMNEAKTVPAYDPSGRHWVFEKLEEGRFIKLEDNSLWEISPYDRSTSQLWLPTEEIVILETGEGDFPYQLMNRNNEDTASAQLLAF